MQQEKQTIKKHLKFVKQELLASFVEHSDGEEDYSELIEEVRNAKEPQDGIDSAKKCKNLLKATTKKNYKHSRKTE